MTSGRRKRPEAGLQSVPRLLHYQGGKWHSSTLLSYIPLVVLLSYSPKKAFYNLLNLMAPA